MCTEQMRASCDIPDTNYTVLLMCAMIGWYLVMVCRVSSKDRADRAGRAKERDEGTSQCISYTAGCGSRAAALHPTSRDLHSRL